MRATSAHSRLRLLQQRIYRALEREADSVYGKAPNAIRRYEERCRKDFGTRFQISSKTELLTAIRTADVTFIGDFHTFAQSQRTALRLLREVVQPGERWMMGLELIPSQYQKTLDDFQSGKLSLKRFHGLIRYQEEWGFPWKNYEPIFQWAREHSVRLIALNRPKEFLYRNFATRSEENGKDLEARDQWAAGIITDLFHSDPSLKMLVLYGGLHVGTRHLPAHLAKVSRPFLNTALRSVTVHQNDPNLYWKLARQERELHAQVLRLKRGVFCVFSGTPWAQLQSLIGSAEGEDLETPESQDPHDEVDYLSLMSTYGGVIAEFLGLKRRSFESLNIRTIEEADFIESLPPHFSNSEIRLIQHQIDNNHRIYLARAQIAYLASPSPNAAAEFAAIHLLRQQARLTTRLEPGRENFFCQTLEAAFGFLGSLILNPRRKCDLPADHTRRLRRLARGEKPAFALEAESRALALTVLKPGRSRERALEELKKSRGLRVSCSLVAARFVGQILARQIHPVLLHEKHGSAGFERIILLFQRKRGFEEAYNELLALKSGRHSSKNDAL